MKMTKTELEILKIICKEEHVNIDRVLDTIHFKSRKGDLIRVRQMYYYFKKKLTKESLESIGNVFNQDHATVLHAVRKIEGYIDSYPDYKRKIKSVEARIVADIDEEFLNRKEELMSIRDSFILEMKLIKRPSVKLKNSVKDFVYGFNKMLNSLD